MNRLVRWPALAGGIVMTAVLAPLAPTFSNRAHAQITVRIESGGYYSPYGQGPYGGYGQVYDRTYVQRYGVPLNQGGVGMFGGGAGYPGYGNTSYRNGYSYGYRSAPYVRTYGRTIYYQPTYRPVYVPFGYGSY